MLAYSNYAFRDVATRGMQHRKFLKLEEILVKLGHCIVKIRQFLRVENYIMLAQFSKANLKIFLLSENFYFENIFSGSYHGGLYD